MKTMKAVTILTAVLAICLNAYCDARLSQARKMIDNNKPEEAIKLLNTILQEKPSDPYILYDIAVAEYSAKNYDQAEKIWQDLAATTLPKKLEAKAWMQIGNVSFRKGEPLEQSAPEQAIPVYEQSLEAYKIALATYPKDSITKHNLKVVEEKLARLHTMLAQKLLNDINEKSPLKEQIEKLEAALDHQRTAKELVPKNEEYARNVENTQKQLSSALTQRANQQEQRADSTMNNPSAQRWEREQAIKNLENALTDFREASNLNQKNEEAKKGEERVMEKLSTLLTREAKQLHEEAKREAPHNPDEAVPKYEQAIDKYNEALQLNEKNETAQNSREQAQKELENLLMKQGDKLANEGRQKKEQNPAEAAEKMMNALNNYEHAMEINPDNKEAPPKIRAIEKELPPLLMALGEREQQRAAQEEQKSLDKAVAHLEKAATSYDMVQQIDENNKTAQERSDQVRNDLIRMREKLVKLAQQKAQQEQKQQYTRDFNTLLGWAKNDDKQKEYEAKRNPTTKYNPQNERIFKNW
ncbi:MAG TPA: tetratricopeptide repeat protein [Verrucomicrobiota bacterium]|nr:tetratricopeptide repeat protein [Verrucomicrobiota bacterium]